MALLIDGYNLLHATDIFGADPGSFQQSREALLAFLAATLKDSERKEAVIVFDAAQAPPGLPDTVSHDALVVRYARNYPDADALIEELIEQNSAPRSLLVVSSDHRVQRAARRGGARFVDSDRWYAELWQRRVQGRRRRLKSIPEKPIGELSPDEIAYWVREFQVTGAAPCSNDQPAEAPERRERPPEQPENPFPPGYGEDLLQDGDDTPKRH